VTTSSPTLAEREPTLTRTINAPREKLFRAWTEPELLKQWFAPSPWTVVTAQIDVRPGGSSRVVMRGPDGQEMPGRCVYLEVVKNERLVFTDAFTSAWEPSDKAFSVVTVTLGELGGGRTQYTARVLHWSVADRETHEKMGFHAGWALCADQLAALVAKQ
jgi:uncharacterized protein YndB with AHSA1/START domain